MQAPDDSPITPTLAICGWTGRTPSLLQAIEARGMVPVAVADRSVAALVAAAATFRGRTEAPARYQHPREMLRRTGGTTVLLDMPGAATEAAEASRGGASVLVVGDAIEPEALDALARMRAAASIVRPLWWRTPVAAFIEAARSAGPFSSLTLAAGEDRPAQAIAEDLVSLAARLGHGAVSSMTSNAYAPPRRGVDSVVGGLRFEDRATALVVARRVRDTHIRAELTSPSPAVSVTIAGDWSGATITVARAGRSATTRLEERDGVALAVEAALEELAFGGVGRQRLSEEASLLRSFRASLAGSGDAAHTRWSVLAGGGQLSPPRRGHLHLVTA